MGSDRHKQTQRRNGFRPSLAPQLRIQTGSYDRFGRPLQEGDKVYRLNNADVVWEVVKLQPSMHPQAPPGTMELVLTATLVTGLPGGQNIADLLLVLPAEPPPTPETGEMLEDPAAPKLVIP